MNSAVTQKWKGRLRGNANGSGRKSVGASNFKFHLADSQGETLEDLGIALGDQFDLIEADSKQSFSCLLRTNRHIKPNVTYKLCVEAFSETAEIEFEFAGQ